MLVVKHDNEAKEFVMTVSELHNNIYAKLWLNKSSPVFCVIMYDIPTNTIPVCIALLHKIDVDPQKIFISPVLLDYIFTVREHRQKGYAYYLVQKMCKHNRIITYCRNAESIDLFVKCGFSYNKENCMARFPPENKIQDAMNLYNICKYDGCENIPNPVEWVKHKQTIRVMWKELCDKPTHTHFETYMQHKLMNNSFGTYMKYMYENF